MSLSVKEAFKNRAEYRAVLPGFEEIRAELIRLARDNPRLWQYQRGGQEIDTWGYLLETMCTRAWDEETTIDLLLIERVWDEKQDKYRAELEQGAALWLHYLAKYDYEAVYCNIWENTEKSFPILWSYMLKNPHALLSLRKRGTSPALKRFEEQYIRLWQEDDGIMREWISKIFCLERIFDESLNIDLRSLFHLFENRLEIKQVLADKVFENITCSEAWVYERLGVGCQGKQQRIKEVLNVLADFGINPITLLLRKWYTCNNITFIDKFLQFQAFDKRITMKELVEHLREGEPEHIPDRRTRYCADFYITLIEHLQIENQDSEAAKWLLDRIIRVLSEEELFLVKDKGLFRFGEIAHSTRTALEKGYLQKLPFLIQWRGEYKEEGLQ